MSKHCYVIVNNAGHSWSILSGNEAAPVGETNQAILARLLEDPDPSPEDENDRLGRGARDGARWR